MDFSPIERPTGFIFVYVEVYGRGFLALLLTDRDLGSMHAGRNHWITFPPTSDIYGR